MDQPRRGRTDESPQGKLRQGILHDGPSPTAIVPGFLFEENGSQSLGRPLLRNDVLEEGESGAVTVNGIPEEVKASQKGSVGGIHKEFFRDN